MNKVILIGRLTRDPEIRYTQGEQSRAIARYTLAVDRRSSKKSNSNEPTADFIDCVAFDYPATFAEKYFRKSMKVAIAGRIRNNNFVNQTGQKVYRTEILIEEQDFAESKRTEEGNTETPVNNGYGYSGDDFMNVDDMGDDGYTFN